MFLPRGRFSMQVLLNGRRFPVAEASSKKVAKKDAAAITLRMLTTEMLSTGDDVDQVMEILPDPSASSSLNVWKKSSH